MEDKDIIKELYIKLCDASINKDVDTLNKTLASPFRFGKSWWKLRQDVLLEKVNDTWIIKQSKASSY